MRLGGEVFAEVRLRHGGDGVAAHGGVEVDAVGLVASGGVEVAEEDVTAKVRGGYYDGDELGGEDGAADFDGSADVAAGGRAVEGGAGFVVSDGGVEGFEGSEDFGEVGGHPLGSSAAAISGDADGAAVAEGCEVLRGWGAEEEDAFYTGEGEGFEDVGGAGEVVAVVGVEHG